MKNLFRENVVEALVGLLVVLLAAWFAWFAWDRTGGGGPADAIRVTALFPNASGVAVGTDVRVAGLKVGTVAEQKLDPQSFQVDVTLALDPTLKMPKDSSAAITSEGLLGSTFIALAPGGDPAPLKSGDTIVDTQGSIDLMGMIGQFINKSGSDTPATPK
ncbi:outer membrane lipid asymmetry maintenance protein MlaD [Sphingomonas solaris]|uniref:Outer membrane lipid asymmetry maintenance protein MlaD n=1 Tax=Alterirhizorhabdus solaris TaxID=2529389 RepID=A0A558R2T9_9SPHN|nr:outer membrane lipid asymmetry maintenance protein MlaD [Sphingomonas solaris]TVV73704.1 outer membrane lipid asymmetry maintenance protein MlaD [Sphingomonas solaris]